MIEGCCSSGCGQVCLSGQCSAQFVEFIELVEFVEKFRGLFRLRPRPSQAESTTLAILHPRIPPKRTRSIDSTACLVLQQPALDRRDQLPRQTNKHTNNQTRSSSRCSPSPPRAGDLLRSSPHMAFSHLRVIRPQLQ